MSLPSLYIDGLKAVVDDYDAYIIDLWGVVHDGVNTYTQAPSCLSELKKRGKQIYFLSNAPRRVYLVEDQLKRLGIHAEKHYHGIYTSGENTYENLFNKTEPSYQKLGIKVYPLSMSVHMPLFKDLDLIPVEDIKEATFILNTGPAYAESHDFDEILRKAQRQNLPMICANPDISVISGGNISLCAGTFARHYESIGGIVHYHGKPYPKIYQDLLLRMERSGPQKILAIGDSLATDIKGANSIGMDCALVMTGLAKQEFGISEHARERLQQTSQKKSIYPTYVLPQLIF